MMLGVAGAVTVIRTPTGSNTSRGQGTEADSVRRSKRARKICRPHPPAYTLCG